MRIIERAKLIVGKRQRTSYDATRLNDLKESILARGLLHPPVVQFNDEGMAMLIAGERRTMAIEAIAKDGLLFFCDGKTITPGELPVTTVEEMTELERQETELEENVIREELPWQDRIRALAFIHEGRVALNPSQSPTDTARELADKGGVVGASGGPVRNIAAIRQTVTEASIVARHLFDPSIRKARNAAEAFNLVMAKEQNAFKAELIRRSAAIPQVVNPIEVRHGDLLQILPVLDAEKFDLILADPPYGIGVDSGGFRARSVQHHTYKDDPDTVRKLLQCILLEGFRITKARANVFLFIDIDFFVWLKGIAAQCGWVPFRTPLTWVKSDSEGLAPWGSHGPRRTCEWLFYATKGQRGLISSPVDILRHNRVSRDEREYGPEKPISLLRELISSATLPGDAVLDPCCGSGSTLAAARELSRSALGIEKDERAYNISLVKAKEGVAEETQQETPAALEDL